MVYLCVGALKQGFRVCSKEILGLDGCFMSGPCPGQILTSVGDDANNRIYPVAYVIVEAESKASWQKGLIQAIASVFPNVKHKYCVRNIHENMKSQFKRGVYKEMLWNAAKATSVGEFNKKMAELKSYNSDAYDWLMKILVEQWSRAHFQAWPNSSLMLSKKATKKWKLTGIPCKHDMAVIYNMSENSVGVAIPEQWVHAAYRLETWAHVYSFKVNPCNNREMWPVVESPTVIIPHLYKPLVGRPPKKRKKSHDEIASESCSSSKLSRKGKSVKCASARQAASARNVSGQATGARNVSSQSGGSSQPSAAQSTSICARNASSQVVGASQPSAAPSTTSQGPTQHSAGPRQGFQAPRPAPVQRLTKKIASRHGPRKLSS
ncbi:hypothetical protein Tco_1493556 [Tanacetum coccineum]